MIKSEKKFTDISCPVCGVDLFKTVAFRFDSGRIVSCSQCGHIYLNPTLTDEHLDTIYSGYHVKQDEDLYMEIVNSNFSRPDGAYQHVLNEIERRSGFIKKSALDVGCGPGRFLYECQKRGALVTGIDLSQAAPRLAKKYFNLDIISKNIEQLNEENYLEPGKFDMIFAFEIIEHVRKPAEFLKMLHKLLAPGGQIYISTPNFYMYDLMGKGAPAICQCPEHIQFFSPASLESCVKLCDYRIVDIAAVTPVKYGERIKQKYSRINIINNPWKIIRRIGPVISIKNRIIDALNKRQDIEHVKSWNGATLIAVLQRPAGEDAKQ